MKALPYSSAYPFRRPIFLNVAFVASGVWEAALAFETGPESCATENVRVAGPSADFGSGTSASLTRCGWLADAAGTSKSPASDTTSRALARITRGYYPPSTALILLAVVWATLLTSFPSIAPGGAPMKRNSES